MTAPAVERPHGYARYKCDGCRCYTCAFAVSQYRLHVEKEQRKGTWQPFTDAEPVRKHVRKLMAAGIGRRRVAELGQVSGACITKLLYGQRGNGPTKQMRPATAQRLLSIPIAESSKAPSALVNSVGVHRRIQALAAMGWSLTLQAEHIGWAVNNLALMLKRPLVASSTAELVKEMYDRLSMTHAPASYGRSRVLSLAKAKGWFPPLAWDEEAIDDLDAVPVLMPPAPGERPHLDEWAIQHKMAGHDMPITREGEFELVHRLIGAGWQFQRIAEFLGRSRHFVEVARGARS